MTKPMHPILYRAARWIAAHRTAYSVLSVSLYIFVLFPVTWIVFPDSNLWLGMAVLWVGFMQEVKDLADQLAGDADESDARQNR